MVMVKGYKTITNQLQYSRPNRSVKGIEYIFRSHLNTQSFPAPVAVPSSVNGLAAAPASRGLLAPLSPELLVLVEAPSTQGPSDELFFMAERFTAFEAVSGHGF